MKKDKEQTKIANILEAAISKDGRTKADIAALAGMQKGSFNSRLNNPTYDTLERICNALGVEVWQLLQPASAESTRESKSEISGFLKANGKIIEVRTIEDLKDIINQQQEQ